MRLSERRKVAEFLRGHLTPIRIKQMRIPVYHVDAFTDHPFGGNPAAVCPLHEWLDDEVLRNVAAENNLSATAFFVQKEEAYELRWFTPLCEIRLCGHATLAAAYVILTELNSSETEVQFETRFSGRLAVTQDSNRYCMDFPAFQSKVTDQPSGLLAALNGESRPRVILEANDTFIAVFEKQEAVEQFRPNFERLSKLHPFAVAITARGNEVDFVSRYFAPSYGVPEDPVTGSVHCVLTPYWADQLGKPALRARQLSERSGDLSCQLAGDRVVLKAGAVLTMRASLTI